MLYLIAVIIPPLATLFAGKVITSIILGALWAPFTFITIGATHPAFVIIAWIIIASAKGDRRHKETLATIAAKGSE